MNFIELLTYVADIMYLIHQAADIVVMGIIFSTMIVGFFYALSIIAIQKSLSFLPFFK